MGSSKLNMISGASVLLGNGPVTENEDNVAWTTGDNLYEDIYREVLQLDYWSFAKAKKQLSRLTASPLNEWTFAYQKPSDIIDILGTYPNVNYAVYEDLVYANVSSLALEYTFRCDESRLSPLFVSAMKYRLAYDMAIPVTGSVSKKDSMGADFEKFIVKAMTKDAQQQPQRKWSDAPLVNVRL